MEQRVPTEEIAPRLEAMGATEMARFVQEALERQRRKGRFWRWLRGRR